MLLTSSLLDYSSVISLLANAVSTLYKPPLGGAGCVPKGDNAERLPSCALDLIILTIYCYLIDP